ncbi:outer membrane protein assembly factor BamB family protein [Caldithrix abyssi]
MNMRRIIVIVLLILFVIGCQNPGVKVSSLNELPQTLHEGWNTPRWYLHNSELDTPLTVVKEKNINGLATPAILNPGARFILTTYNGFLLSTDLQLKDIGRKRFSRGLSAAPCFARPLAYIASEKGAYGLTAYDLIRQKVQWQLKGYFSKSSPLVFQEVLIHATIKGQVLALNRLTGQKIWAYSFPQKLLQNLAMTERTIVVCSGDGLLAAVNLDDGREKFMIELPQHVYTAPLILNGHVFIADLSGNILKIALESGKIIADKALKTPFYQPLSTDGQTLYIMGSNGRLFALSQDLQLKWSLALKGAPSMPIIVTARRLIVATHQKQFYLINRQTRNIDQQFTFKRRVVSCTPAPGGQLLIAMEYDRLARLSLKQEKR